VRPRLIALGGLALILGIGAAGMAYAGAQLQFAGQRIGLGLSGGAQTPADFEQQRFLFVFSFALQPMVAPLATAALLAVVAILAVLARREQLRRRARAR
jgi:hypothetical protein